jgi:hypothetical protein
MGIDHRGPIEAGDGEKIGNGRCRPRTQAAIVGKDGHFRKHSAPDDALSGDSLTSDSDVGRLLTELAGLPEAQRRAIIDAMTAPAAGRLNKSGFGDTASYRARE